MLQSFNLHQWSSDGKTWEMPNYHNKNLGGSAQNWPTKGLRLPFWGGNGNHGGFYHGRWNKAFQLFFTTGIVEHYLNKT